MDEKNVWLERLASNIRCIRTSKGMSQQSLAEKSKLGIATIGKIESMRLENPTLGTISAIGQALGLEDSLKLLTLSSS